MTSTADPGTGGCTAAGNGDGCTLREAITAANAAPGNDIISVAPGVTGIIQLQGVLPDLSSNITIQGPSASVLTVRRNTGGVYRIFFVVSGQTVRISGLTMANGQAGGGFPVNGGGIFNDGGTLTVTNSVLSGNSAVNGGAIFNDGPLTVTNSAVSANGASENGGGIYNRNGLLTVQISTISTNTASTGGGFYVGPGSTLAATGCTINGNTATAVNFGAGGVYLSASTATLTNCTGAGNTGSDGAGIFSDINDPTLNLNSCTVTDNLTAY